MGKPKSVPPELAAMLSYDEETGLLTWRVAVKWGTIPAGTSAGSTAKGKAGYKVINYKRKLYQVHRIIWFMVTGEQPPDIIDHKDGDPTNSRWSNLRAATPKQNAANSRPRLGRKRKGVFQFGDRYRAAICVDGKTEYLGSYASADEAHFAYSARAKQVFGDYARSR